MNLIPLNVYKVKEQKGRDISVLRSFFKFEDQGYNNRIVQRKIGVIFIDFDKLSYDGDGDFDYKCRDWIPFFDIPEYQKTEKSKDGIDLESLFDFEKNNLKEEGKERVAISLQRPKKI